MRIYLRPPLGAPTEPLLAGDELGDELKVGELLRVLFMLGLTCRLGVCTPSVLRICGFPLE